MKATKKKKEKDLALRGAENLNKLRIDANGMEFNLYRIGITSKGV